MKKRIFFIINLILSLSLAVVCGYVFCVRSGGLTAHVWSLPLWYVLFLLCAFPLVDFLHEIGHFIVGRALKMGITFPKIRLFSSSSVVVNPKTIKGLKLRMVATASAGVIFTCIAAVLGAMTLFLPQIPVVLVCLTPYAFYLTLNNAAPFEYDGDRCDGLIVCELIFDKPEGKVLLALLEIAARLNLGEELKNLDEELLMNLPQLCEDDKYFIELTKIRYEYYKSKDELDKAQKYHERFKSLETEYLN